MAIDVLTFLRYINEQTGPQTDAFGVPGLDSISDQRERDKQTRKEEIQRKKTEAHDTHLNKLHLFLTKKGFKINDSGLDQGGKVRLLGDSNVKLVPGEYAFFHPSSGRTDLEVNHNGKLIKVELKGKWVGDQHQKQYHYNFPYQKPITIKTPHGDLSISPSEFAKKIKGRSKKTVSAYSMSNKEVFDILGESIQEKLYEKLKSIPIETPNGIVHVNLRDLRAGKYGTLPLSHYRQIQAALYGMVPIGSDGKGIRRIILGKDNETSLVTHRPRTLKEYTREVIEKSMPSILGSLDSHISIAGNGLQILIGHHRQACEENIKSSTCDERKNAEEFLKHLNLTATHEASNIGLSRSPTAGKQDEEDEDDSTTSDQTGARGPTGNFGLSYKSHSPQVKPISKTNAIEIHGEDEHKTATEESSAHIRRRKAEAKMKREKKNQEQNQGA